MDSVWLNVFFLILLTVFNGLFCLSEVALVASRRTRLQMMLDEGDRRVPCAMDQHANPTATLATVQTGMTIVAIISGILGESALSKPISELLMRVGLSQQTAYVVALTFIVFMVSYMTIVLGELVPKRIAQCDPENIFCAVAKPLKGLAILITPFIWLLSATTEAILKVFGLAKGDAEAVTEEEITALINEGSKSGAIEETEKEMVQKVFQLDDRTVGSVMTPRTQIDWIDLESDPHENLKKLLASRHSHILVAHGSLDNVGGACTTRQILQDMAEGKEPDFSDGLTNISVVPESQTCMKTLETFKRDNASVALVIDEYGAVTGMVTTQDLLEAIVGQFGAQQETSAANKPNSFTVEGLLPLQNLQELLNIDKLDEELTTRFNTIAGLITHRLGRIPRANDTIEWEGWRFTVAKMTRYRIDLVRIERHKQQSIPAAKAG